MFYTPYKGVNQAGYSYHKIAASPEAQSSSRFVCRRGRDLILTVIAGMVVPVASSGSRRAVLTGNRRVASLCRLESLPALLHWDLGLGRHIALGDANMDFLLGKVTLRLNTQLCDLVSIFVNVSLSA